MPRDIAATAECLRLVKQVNRQFLLLWAIDRFVNRPGPLDLLPPELQRAMSDPRNRDWSILYRGDVLDD